MKEILRSLGEVDTQDGLVTSMRRIGEAKDNKLRPILVSVSSGQQRNKIVDAARNNAALGNIRIKKDTSPAVRKEWGRLFKVKEEEEQ